MSGELGRLCVSISSSCRFRYLAFPALITFNLTSAVHLHEHRCSRRSAARALPALWAHFLLDIFTSDCTYHIE